MTPLGYFSRRTFLKQAAAVTAVGMAARGIRAAAAPAVTSGGVSPNSRIQLGIIGCGGMGRANLEACAGQPDVVIRSACDVWGSRLDAVVKKFPDTCTGYRDFRELLADPGLDAVIIATPPHWHALQAVAACEAGKDIYLQKPMTLHLGESLAVRNAVRKHKVITQVGTQIHAGDNYRRVVEFIRSGELGRVGTVRTFNVMNQSPDGIGRAGASEKPADLDWELWCGPAPLCRFNPTLAADAYNHSSWMDYGGGWTPGMAPHIIDLPIWACDLAYPLSVSSSGGRLILEDDGDAYDNHEVLWQYPKLSMTWMSSLTNSYGFDFQGDPAPRRRLGIYFHGSKGTLFSDYGMHKVVPEGPSTTVVQTPPPSIPPSPGHEREWLDCVKSRKQPSCSVHYHTFVDVPITLSVLSLKLGRTLRFDPVDEKIVGDKEAARLAIPKYRAPWKFPKQYYS